MEAERISLHYNYMEEINLNSSPSYCAKTLVNDQFLFTDHKHDRLQSHLFNLHDLRLGSKVPISRFNMLIMSSDIDHSTLIIQPHPHPHPLDVLPSVSVPLRNNSRAPSFEVRPVFASNLDREFRMIQTTIKGKRCYVTLDREFKLASSRSTMINSATTTMHPCFLSPEERYRAIRKGVDGGSIRQLGLTISSDDDGSVHTWEFNFRRFHCLADMNEEAMWQNDLINSYFFSELLLKSGLMDKERVTWIMFHGAYDVAYLMKLAICWSPLLESLAEFEYLVKKYLGENIFDVKHMIKFTNNLYGGLSDVARALMIERVVGQAHEAGSDSLLTWHTYQKLKELYFPCDDDRGYAGFLYGIHDI